MGMDTVDLLVRIENHFGIHIPDSEAERILTVQDFYDAVSRHLLLVTEEAKGIIIEDVIHIIADHTGYDVSEIQPHLKITYDLGLD